MSPQELDTSPQRSDSSDKQRSEIVHIRTSLPLGNVKANIVIMTHSPLGEFEVLVLMAVMRLADDANGSKVHDEIQQRTNRTVARGSVYMTLDRLETKKLLVSRVAPATEERAGRPTRLYRALPAGVRAVEQSLTALARMQDGLKLSIDPIKAR